MVRGGPDPGFLPLPWPWASAWCISPTAGQVLVVGLHPVPFGPGATLAAPGFGSSVLLSHGAPIPRSPVWVLSCNASCARGCRLVGLFRYRIWCPIVALIVVQHIYPLDFDLKQNAIALDSHPFSTPAGSRIGLKTSCKPHYEENPCRYAARPACHCTPWRS